MLLTEYDEEQHMRAAFKEGYEEGEAVGRQKLLEELVQKKLNRGKSIREIAEELEVEIEEIEEVIKGK